MDLIKCPQCGSEINEWTAVCPSCGFRVATTASLEKRRKENPTLRDAVNKIYVRHLIVLGLGLLLAFSGLFLHDITNSNNVNLFSIVMYAGLALVGVSVIMGIFLIRCPRCGGNLTRLYRPILDAKYCPYCRVDFDEEMKTIGAERPAT